MVSPSQHDDQLRVERRLEGTAVVIRAAGDVDNTTAPLLSQQLSIATDEATPPPYWSPTCAASGSSAPMESPSWSRPDSAANITT